MKKILYTTLILILTASVSSSCDKMDCNGDLDGMWQMTRWEKRADQTIVADNNSGFYYYFKLDLMKFSNVNETTYYLSRFQHIGDSLFIGEVYKSPFDEVVPVEELKHFGGDVHGKFRILELSSSKMILCNTENILSFRKY